MTYKFNVFHYANLYKRYWKILIFTVVLSMLFAGSSLSRKPTVYVSTVTLLLTSRQRSIAGLEKISELTVNPSKEVIISLFRSRRMAKDIRDHFDLTQKSGFWYSVSPYQVGDTFAIRVKGSDPALIQKIADFVVENLDKLNTELDILPSKPIVKILDPATYGSAVPKQNRRKIVLSGVLAFLGMSVCVFFADYIRMLKND